MRWLPALVLSLGLLAATAAHAQDYAPEYAWAEAGAPPPPVATLDAYGGWVDAQPYGRVWRPGVAVGWRPYVHGSWAWSPAGWTWVSVEPWGWTFHYGRWALAPAFGWVWVPGTVWGPAWVDWYWGDGYVGWAPLAPGFVHVTVIDRYVFVREHDFCGRHVHSAAFDHRRLPRDVARGWRRHGGRKPDFDHLSRRHPVTRVGFDRRRERREEARERREEARERRHERREEMRDRQREHREEVRERREEVRDRRREHREEAQDRLRAARERREEVRDRPRETRERRQELGGRRVESWPRPNIPWGDGRRSVPVVSSGFRHAQPATVRAPQARAEHGSFGGGRHRGGHGGAQVSTMPAPGVQQRPAPGRGDGRAAARAGGDGEGHLARQHRGQR